MLRDSEQSDTIKHNRICGLRLQTEEGTVLAIFSVCMPARRAKDNLVVSLVELESIIESLGEEVIPIVCGDFNGDIGI